MCERGRFGKRLSLLLDVGAHNLRQVGKQSVPLANKRNNSTTHSINIKRKRIATFTETSKSNLNSLFILIFKKKKNIRK